MKRLINLLLPVLLFSGCAQISKPEPEIDNQTKSFLWLEHQIAANVLQSWKIKGRLAVKNAREDATVTLYWNQVASTYELRLIAPFAQGTYILKGSTNGVVMKGPKNLFLSAATPEQLLQEWLGWEVRLAGLKYWVRGIPELGVNYSELVLDENGRLSNMHQSGFDIQILRYAKQGNIALPEKLFIKNDNIQIKMMIQSWTI